MSISKPERRYLAGFFSGLGVFFNLYDIYYAWRYSKTAVLRAVRVISNIICLILNSLYVGGVLASHLFSNFGLGMLAFFSCAVSLGCYSFVTYKARQAVKDFKAALVTLQEQRDNLKQEDHHELQKINLEIQTCEKELFALREDRFKSKVDMVHSAISFLTSSIFLASVFFPPLFLVSVGTLVVTTIVQFFDTKNNYNLSRSLISKWDRWRKHKKKNSIEIEDIIQQKKEMELSQGAEMVKILIEKEEINNIKNTTEQASSQISSDKKMQFNLLSQAKDENHFNAELPTPSHQSIVKKP